MSKGKRRGWRIRLILVALLLAAGLGFVFSPSAFVRGAILGAVVGPLALVAAFGLFMRRMRKKVMGSLQPPTIPTAASWDYEMALTDLEGASRSAGEFRGEILVLNIWATWCAPCVAEMPSLERLRAATEDLGVRFACVSQEPVEKVAAFMKKRGFDLPVFVVEGDLPETFSSRAVPATYVIDRKGSIAMRHIGAAQWDAERVVTYIRGLAAAP